MIILRKSRTMKHLKVRLATIYEMSVSIRGAQMQLTQVPLSGIRSMYTNEDKIECPQFFALNNENEVYIYPRPNRDYRARIVGTTMVQL